MRSSCVLVYFGDFAPTSYAKDSQTAIPDALDAAVEANDAEYQETD